MTNTAIAGMPAQAIIEREMLQLPSTQPVSPPTITGRFRSDQPAPNPKGRLLLHGPGSPRRLELEGFIRDEYRKHFDADVTEFMPTFLALHDANDKICAAVGCRNAADEPLFLERYTDSTIERTIAERIGKDVPRERIVEIGSLACRDGRAAMAIVCALIPYLIGAGFTWVAFTGADTVVNVLRRLKLKPIALCTADSSRLGSAKYAWGSYYDHDPIVMAGRLLDGVDSLEFLPRVQ